jgi:hypothetical protein
MANPRIHQFSPEYLLLPPVQRKIRENSQETERTFYTGGISAISGASRLFNELPLGEQHQTSNLLAELYVDKMLGNTIKIQQKHNEAKVTPPKNKNNYQWINYGIGLASTIAIIGLFAYRVSNKNVIAENCLSNFKP